MTAKTINDIFNLMSQDSSYEKILRKFLANKQERDEFRQEIHLQICEANREKIIHFWNSGNFKWFFVRIVSNNIKSKTSQWYYKEKKNREIPTDIFFTEYFEDEYEEEQENSNEKLQKIFEIISQKINEKPLLLREFNLLKMRYLDDLTFEEIHKKTNIPLGSIFNYIKKAENIIKKEIKKNK